MTSTVLKLWKLFIYGIPYFYAPSFTMPYIKSLAYTPLRIISLVPSITEMLYDLVPEERVVAITKFCVRPEHWFRNKVRIGGTKELDIEKIISLKPDLIIANREENVKEQVDELAGLFPIYITDINNFEEAIDMIISIGELTGSDAKAATIAEKIQTSFSTIKLPSTKLRAAYFIWKDPFMVSGGDTFISKMMEKAGFINVFADRLRYPEIAKADLDATEPDYLLLSSEPYPFKEKHFDAMKELYPDAKCLLVDGEMFSWYGSRMLYGGEYFQKLSLEAVSIAP